MELEVFDPTKYNIDTAVVRVLTAYVPTGTLALINIRYAEEVRKIRSLITPLTREEIRSSAADKTNKIGYWSHRDDKSVFLACNTIVDHHPESAITITSISSYIHIYGSLWSFLRHTGLDTIRLDYYSTARILLQRESLAYIRNSDRVTQGIFVREILRLCSEVCKRLKDQPRLLYPWSNINNGVLGQTMVNLQSTCSYLQNGDLTQKLARHNVSSLPEHLENALWELLLDGERNETTFEKEIKINRSMAIRH